MGENSFYTLTDESRAKRVNELIAVPNPTALDSELAVCRVLFEEAVNANDTQTAIAFTRVIRQLAETTEAVKFRRGELLSRVAALNIVQQIVDVLAHEVEGKFAGWENVIETVNTRLLTVVARAENAPEEGQNNQEVRPDREGQGEKNVA
jgi:hypothetical protein